MKVIIWIMLSVTITNGVVIGNTEGNIDGNTDGNVEGNTDATGSKNIEWTVKDCEWSEWQLGECSKSCDGGIRTNTRTKTIEEVNGGVCEGGEITEETCNTESCPVDPCDEIVIDCTKDEAKEACPKKCSEPNVCKFADCSATRNLEICPITCAKEKKQEKDKPSRAATSNPRENIYLQISDITVPTFGYKEIDFTDAAKCIPNKAKNEINVYGAMTGYDAIKGNPMNSLVDPGVKARIFLHDCKFGYFDFVSDVRNNLQCDSDFSMKTIESMDQYEQERKGSNTFSAGASISAKGGFGAIKGSASASYTRSSNSDQMASEKVLEKYKGEITRAKATCLTHSVTIADNVRPVFTPDFIHHLEDMDAAARGPDEELKKKAVSKFVNEFGTHYSKDTRLGAELIYERRFENKGKSIQEKKERNSCVKDEAEVSASVSSPSVEVSAKGHYNNQDCEGMKEGSDFSNNEGFEAVKTISRGSRPKDIKSWIDATFTPVAIKRTLEDISNLFEDKWMTKSVFYGFNKNLAGSDIKAMYNKYIEQYCSLMLYGILDENCNVIACTDANFKCYNGGTCTNFEGSPRCDCPAETYGKFCEIAWLFVAEEKTCKDTKGVTIIPTDPFTNIVDCASACKAKLQNTMFAFENKAGCEKSDTGCQCHCIESVTNDCSTIDQQGFTLYKFRTETATEFLLADTQAECSDIDSSTIVGVDSADGCQQAVKSLGVENPDVIIEDQPSVPKGCYVYRPSNKLYFNQHSTGLDKAQWTFDTRKVCRDFQTAMDTAGGCGEIEVTSDLEIQKCRIGTYKLQQQVLNEKPVFKHETKEEYLFYMKKGKGFWMFGSEVGTDNGGIMNGICNDVGEKIVNVPVESVCPSRWFFWSKSSASWLVDNSMSVRCPDSPKEDSTKEDSTKERALKSESNPFQFQHYRFKTANTTRAEVTSRTNAACTPWGDPGRSGCLGGDSWTPLDTEKKLETSDCESLCLKHASTTGCCIVMDGIGCYWKSGAVAVPADYGGATSTNCTALKEHCEENQFRCGNGNCIPIEYRCDRFSNEDCSDGSDEDNCDPCTPSPCNSNEECVPTGFDTKGFAMHECRDPCDPNPCQRGGSCVGDNMGSHTCNCGKYSGTNCEIDPCSPDPCKNLGICSYDGTGGYKCDCRTTGYKGLTCNEDGDFLVTGNDGYCCISNNVKHHVCIISTVENQKGYVSGFEISECETICLNDDLCKGFSIQTITANDRTVYNCYLYTTSEASTYCSFNDESLKRERNMDFSVDFLDQNAKCLETLDIPYQVKLDYNYGCQIKKSLAKKDQASTTEEQDGTASPTSEEQEVTTKQPSSQTKCVPRDDDECLANTPNWGPTKDCAYAKKYCASWAKDARRCCPETCGSGLLTETQCQALDSKGECIYPAKNQCPNEVHSLDDICQSSPGDLCLTLPCGLNAICDASNGDVKCSCPENMVGDPKIKCEDFDPTYTCIITTPLECSKEAKKLGLDVGNKDYSFESDSWSQKGCYFYEETSDSKKKNTAFFGTGGTIKQMVEKARATEDTMDDLGRKSITKKCLAADYKLISEGQKCSTIDSADIIYDGLTTEGYAQICKSMSNKFSVDEYGKGYCHIGTRQNGRCKLEDDRKRDLYEIKFPGYTLAEEGFRCEDIGMKATEELESCKATVTTIQKIIPDVGTSVNERSYENKPTGCYVYDNKIYFNTDPTDSLSSGSRQVCRGPRCNGYPTTDWNCCNPISQCGKGEGDCDTDDDCAGDLICGSSRDGSNNCKNEFIYSGSFWAESADCCTEPECRRNTDCNTSSDPDKKICQAGRCLRCRGGSDCCTKGEKCYEGEGDCDYDDECMPGLRCGENNCRVKVSPWHPKTDCCYKPASCPVITVQKVSDEGQYFYATENELRELFDYESWDAAVMDILQEGDCGFEWVEGTDKEQQWTGCYSGEITAWKSKGGHGRRNCKKCKERGGSGWDTSAAGQWSAGDTIKSKACSLVDPCFNGEQDRYETGIDCGGDCKRKCSSESEREIPWLLWAASTN